MNVDAPKITVAVCTRDRADKLKVCLESILVQEVPRGTSWELVIVDDGSEDQTASIVRELAAGARVPVRYVREKGSGVAAARNRSVREARGDWIAFMDDDEVADPRWLRTLLEAAEESHYDCVGGGIVLALPRPFEQTLGATIRKLFGEVRPSHTLKGRLVYAGPGAGNALVRREVFRIVGTFDESLGTLGEDQDFFRRAGRLGYRIGFAANALIRHHVPVERLTRPALLKCAALSGRSCALLDRRYRGLAGSLLVCGLRLGHAAVATLPLLVVAVLTRSEAHAISRLCSLRFAHGYVCGALSVGSRVEPQGR
jgi:glycosyltransferase involved in cell wall biosynthesis